MSVAELACRAVFIAAGALAIWSLQRDLRSLWERLK